MQFRQCERQPEEGIVDLKAPQAWSVGLKVLFTSNFSDHTRLEQKLDFEDRDNIF